MKIIMLGPPGAGKGTQAQLLVDKFSIPQISTGDLLRAAIDEGSQLGKIAKECIDDGKLVSDEIIIELVKERISKPDCSNGYILDGFPRTVPQAEAMGGLDKIDRVLNIVVDMNVLMERLVSRRTCKSCNAVYNLVGKPPNTAGVCDLCGGVLFQRDDDREEVIQKRFNTYRNQTEPLIEYYSGKGILRNVETGASIEETFNSILVILG